ncbi:MAG: mannosyl-glycoproteinendo-beta-N-acetylglucosaminidase [Labilithrix sp.]|nr:mannosyl-glycoproteinendo-beta-N-acetylglucosaminidase [Labilithrix sp.]
MLDHRPHVYPWSAFFAMLVAACAAPADDEALESSSAAQTDPNDPSWDCYAPEPGHPTAAEKAAFFTRNAPAAQEAERTYGVPAAALLAMAAVEGGYGFTRIALFANNAFGYKFTSSSAAGGRGAYTLACQPSWDVGNRYITFSNIRDGMLFIGYKLATRADWANYKTATDRYRADRGAGGDVRVAVNAWVDGIADAGYNYDPPTYKRTIKSVIAANNLYTYSSALSPGGSSAPSSGGGSSSGSTSSWIAIDSPASDAYVSGDVMLSTTASSNVTRVVFVSIAGSSEYVIASDTAAPFSVSWATAGWVPDGGYVVRFDAYAGATKVASASRRVHVSN